MTRPHVPVLAGELVGALDPQPGEVAVDCTFGAGGHARLVANRIGPTGLLVCIDRDPAAEERFDELAAEVPCQTRFLRMDYADALPLLAEERMAADMVYLDLGVSSMQIDAWERGFSYSYDAPLDMRMDPAQDLRPASSPRRSSPPSPRPRASAAGTRRSASSRRSGSSSTTSSVRSSARCRRHGSSSDPAGESRRSRSTRWRIAASSASSSIVRAGVSAHPTCRFAHAGVRPTLSF
jgi:hypothetical protein